jgi:hypothetical protein
VPRTEQWNCPHGFPYAAPSSKRHPIRHWHRPRHHPTPAEHHPSGTLEPVRRAPTSQRHPIRHWHRPASRRRAAAAQPRPAAPPSRQDVSAGSIPKTLAPPQRTTPAAPDPHPKLWHHPSSRSAPPTGAPPTGQENSGTTPSGKTLAPPQGHHPRAPPQRRGDNLLIAKRAFSMCRTQEDGFVPAPAPSTLTPRRRPGDPGRFERSDQVGLT